jgi:hypothetical protein
MRLKIQTQNKKIFVKSNLQFSIKLIIIDFFSIKLRDMTNLRKSKKLTFFTWTCREFNFRKESGKKSFGRARESVLPGAFFFAKKFFCIFFKNHDVLKLFFDSFFFLIKNCPSLFYFGSLA